MIQVVLNLLKPTINKMARPKTKSTPSDGVIVTIYGFPIRENTLYEVQEKLDSQANEGFKEWNTSKSLSVDFEDRKPGAIWDGVRNIWDTGLYESSSAFRKAFGNDTDANKIIFEKIKEYIIEPYENEKGEGSLDYKNTPERNEFWDNYSIGIKRGKVFNTANIDDLLNLYFCLVHKRLTPKDMESHPEFKQPISYYLVVDKESAISRQAEKEMTNMRAKALFYTMLQSDKDGLLRILDYLGIQAGSNTDEATLVRVFNNYLDNKEDKYQNDKLFLDIIEKYNTEKGKELLFIFGKLKELHRKGRVVFKHGQVIMDDVLVENGWKNSAEKIQTDSELMELFTSLLD